MAYPSSISGKDNSLMIIGGVGVVGFLWYKGYLGAWFPTLFGSQAGAIPQSAQTPLSVNSASTVPSVTQIASPTVQTVQSSPTGGMPPRFNHHTSVFPDAQVDTTVNPDFANESYYTWRASGEPISVLAQIQAAFADEVQGLRMKTQTQVVNPSVLLESSPIPDVHINPTPTPAPVVDYSNPADWTVTPLGAKTPEQLDIMDLAWKDYSPAIQQQGFNLPLSDAFLKWMGQINTAPVGSTNYYPVVPDVSKVAPIYNGPIPATIDESQSRISTFTSANVSAVSNTPTVATIATPLTTTLMHPTSGIPRR